MKKTLSIDKLSEMKLLLPNWHNLISIKLSLFEYRRILNLIIISRLTGVNEINIPKKTQERNTNQNYLTLFQKTNLILKNENYKFTLSSDKSDCIVSRKKTKAFFKEVSEIEKEIQSVLKIEKLINTETYRGREKILSILLFLFEDGCVDLEIKSSVLVAYLGSGKAEHAEERCLRKLREIKNLQSSQKNGYIKIKGTI